MQNSNLRIQRVLSPQDYDIRLYDLDIQVDYDGSYVVFAFGRNKETGRRERLRLGVMTLTHPDNDPKGCSWQIEDDATETVYHLGDALSRIITGLVS